MSNHVALPGMRFFGRLTRSLKDKIVSDVPPEYARCEFDCRKTQCRYEEWLSCPNRLSYLSLEVARRTAPIPNEQASMAHQFDSVCGNEPTPQIMIQLIGCRIETARPLGGQENLTGTANSVGPSSALARR